MLLTYDGKEEVCTAGAASLDINATHKLALCSEASIICALYLPKVGSCVWSQSLAIGRATLTERLGGSRVTSRGTKLSIVLHLFLYHQSFRKSKSS